MQVKPRFESYKILETHPIVIDDTGNQISLTLISATLPSDKDEIVTTPYQFWAVIGKNQVVWGNKAISYDSAAFWKHDNKRKLISTIINDIEITEVEDGEHGLFIIPRTQEIPGKRTRFKIKKIC
jgi:hypothetical protein